MDHAEEWPRGATPCPRSGAAAERNYPTSEYMMRNAGLEEVQAGIKIAGRNLNNLRYAADTTLMAESEEELKSLFCCLTYRVIITTFLNSIYMH